MGFVWSVGALWRRLCKTIEGGGQAPDIEKSARAFLKIGNQKKPFPYSLCMGG